MSLGGKICRLRVILDVALHHGTGRAILRKNGGDNRANLEACQMNLISSQTLRTRTAFATDMRRHDVIRSLLFETKSKDLDAEAEKRRQERKLREGKSSSRSKKPSRRLDVIDKLDVTSIYGTGCKLAIYSLVLSRF